MSSPYCSACLVASSLTAHNLGARNITQVIDITRIKNPMIIFSVRWFLLLVSIRRDMRVSWGTRPKIDVMRVSWSKRTLLSVSISRYLRVSWERAQKLTSCAHREASNFSIGQHRSRCAYLGERAQKLTLCACLEASELFCQSASVGTSAFLGERNKKLTPCVYLKGTRPIKVLLFAIQHQLEQARILSKHAPKMWR